MYNSEGARKCANVIAQVRNIGGVALHLRQVHSARGGQGELALGYDDHHRHSPALIGLELDS